MLKEKCLSSENAFIESGEASGACLAENSSILARIYPPTNVRFAISGEGSMSRYLRAELPEEAARGNKQGAGRRGRISRTIHFASDRQVICTLINVELVYIYRDNSIFVHRQRVAACRMYQL